VLGHAAPSALLIELRDLADGRIALFELEAGGLRGASSGSSDLRAGAVCRYEGDPVGHALFFGWGWPRLT